MKNKENVNKELKTFLADAELNYSQELAYEGNAKGFNPNYRAQLDVNTLIKNIAAVRVRGNAERDKLAVLLSDSDGVISEEGAKDFGELASAAAEEQSKVVDMFEQNLNKLEERLQFYTVLASQRPDLEIDTKITPAQIQNNLNKYLADKSVAEKGTEKTAKTKRKAVKDLIAKTAHR